MEKSKVYQSFINKWGEIEGPVKYDEMRKKSSETRKGKPSKLKGKPSGRKGKSWGNHTSETKAQISSKLKGKLIGEKNPAYGNKYRKDKKHTPETKKKISDKLKGRKLSQKTIQKMKDKTLSKEHKEKLSIKNKERWSGEKGIKRRKEFSERMSGKGNHMFGKPCPKGAGNGLNGYYKEFYFRSSYELNFLVNYVARFNLNCISAEIQEYRSIFTFNGKKKTYIPDFLINDKYLIEIKPRKRQTEELNKAKFISGRKLAKEKNLTYKVIDPIGNNKRIIKAFHNNEITLTSKQSEKFKRIYLEWDGK